VDEPKDKLSLEVAALSERSLEAALEAELGGQSDRLIGLVLEDRYRILERIDSGGIGAVYKAEQLQLKRQVAVKVLHPKYAQNKEFRQRFEREALAASKAKHASCIAVLDFGTVEGRPYLVMEYVEGPLLTDLMEDGTISLQEAVVIGLQLLEALRHAHRHSIVHRDVKPDNVMLCHPDEAGTQIKLLDFGLAKNLLPDAPDNNAVTRDGTICGTPSYMSPEQGVAGEVDARSDLYSLGVVLYEMVCRRKPFLKEEMVQLIQAHLTEPPPRPRELRPEISPELEDVLLRALQKERGNRFQSADAFLTALRAVPEAPEHAKETVVMQAPQRAARERLGTAATVQATAATVRATVDRSALTFEDDAPERTSGKRALTGLQLALVLLVAAAASVGTILAMDRYYATYAGSTAAAKRAGPGETRGDRPATRRQPAALDPAPHSAPSGPDQGHSPSAQ
jgi:serine/threonine protein kinase